MSKLEIKAGTTSKLLDVFIEDPTSLIGEGLTGLVFNSPGLTWYYKRTGDASSTQISLVNAVAGTWSSGGFKEVDAANMKGHYEIGTPNAVLASGVDQVSMQLRGAVNMPPINIEIQLDANIVSDVPTAVENRQEMDSNSIILNKLETLASGKMIWDEANSRFEMYNQSDVLAFYLHVTDKDGSDVVMTGTGPVQRDEKVETV